MRDAIAFADDAKRDAVLADKDARNEDLRSRNSDPAHYHTLGDEPVVDGTCTLASHALEAVRTAGEARELEKAQRRHERAALVAASDLAAAARRLLAGCDLCGRAALPARGREAAA